MTLHPGAPVRVAAPAQRAGGDKLRSFALGTTRVIRYFATDYVNIARVRGIIFS